MVQFLTVQLILSMEFWCLDIFSAQIRTVQGDWSEQLRLLVNREVENEVSKDGMRKEFRERSDGMEWEMEEDWEMGEGGKREAWREVIHLCIYIILVCPVFRSRASWVYRGIMGLGASRVSGHHGSSRRNRNCKNLHSATSRRNQNHN